MKKGRLAAFVLLLAGVVLGTLMRLYVIVVHTDMKTGFLYHGEALFCNLLYYGILLAFAFAALLAVRRDNSEAPPTSAAISGGRCGLIGFPLLIAGLFSIYEGYKEIGAISSSAFLIIIDFLFGAAMLALAFVTLSLKKFTPGLGLGYSAVGIYCTLRGMYCFLNRMVITTVPEYLIELLSLIGMIMFFVLFAKLMSGNQERFTYSGLCFWGVWTAGLTLSSSFAAIIAKLAAPEPIRKRISMTSYETELFRQEAKGRDAYLLTFTPWVNVALGAMVLIAVILLLLRKDTADGSKE